MFDTKLEEIYRCAIILSEYPEMMAKYDLVLKVASKYPLLIPYFHLETIDADYSINLKAIIGDVRVAIKFGVGGDDRPDLNSYVNIGYYNQFKSGILTFSEKSLNTGCQALMEALENSEEAIKANSRVEASTSVESQNRSISSTNDHSNI